MKKIKIILGIMALLSTGCSDLFKEMLVNEQIGNDKIQSGGNGLDAGFVVETPLNDTESGKNRIEFNKDTKTYPLAFGTKDSPVKFACKPEDEKATVVYTVWKIEDEDGNIIKPPKRIEMTSVYGNNAELAHYGYGKFEIVTKIISDDPKISSEYKTLITRISDLGSALNKMDIKGYSDGTAGKEPEMDVTPAFLPEMTEYEVKANEDVDLLKIDVAPYNNAAVVYKVYDKDGNFLYEKADNPVVIDPLNGGNHKIKIFVTEEGQKTKAYLLDVLKPRDDLTSLRSITFKDVNGGVAGIKNHTPNIDKSIDEKGDYRIWVSSDDQLDIKEGVLDVKAVHKYATVKYSSNDCAIGEMDGKVSNLKGGDNKIKITVVAKDGTERDHFVTIKAAAATSTFLNKIVVKSGIDADSASVKIDKNNQNKINSPLSACDYKVLPNNHKFNMIYEESKYGEVLLIPFDKDSSISVKSVTNITPFTVFSSYNYTGILNTDDGRKFTVSNLPDGDTEVVFTITPADTTNGSSRDFKVTFKKPDKSNAVIREMKATIVNSSGDNIIVRDLVGFSVLRPNIATNYYLPKDSNIFNIDIEKFMHSGAGLDSTFSEIIYTHDVDGDKDNDGLPASGSNADIIIDSTTKKITVGSVTSIPAGTSQVHFKVKPQKYADDPIAYPCEEYVFNLIKPAIDETRLVHFKVCSQNSNYISDFTAFKPNDEYIADDQNKVEYVVFRKLKSDFKRIYIEAKSIYELANIHLDITAPDGNADFRDGVGECKFECIPPVSGDYVVLATVTDPDSGKIRKYKGTVSVGLPSDSRLHSMVVKYGESFILTPSPLFVADKSPELSYDCDQLNDITENRNYNQPITITVEPTDPLAQIPEIFPIASDSSVTLTSSWDMDAKKLTITDYGQAEILTIPVKVLSQKDIQNNFDTYSKTYNLTIKIPKLKKVESVKETFFTDKDYFVGQKGTNKMAYSFGSLKDETTSNVPVGGIDIIGSIDSGTTWLSSSENSTDNSPAVDDKRGGWHHKLFVDGIEEWVDIPTGYQNGDEIAVHNISDIKVAVNAEVQYADERGYVKLTYTLVNTGSSTVSNIKLGACSDSQIGDTSTSNSNAKFVKTRYGAAMTFDGKTLGLYLLDGDDVDVVDTFWVGEFGHEHESVNLFGGTAKNVEDGLQISGGDNAVAFSWIIDSLATGDSISRSVRISVGDYKE